MTRAILEEIDANAEELVEFAADLIRIPTVNPPGTDYERCAKIIGDRMSALGYEVEYVEALDRPEHTDEHPRVNVVGTLRSDDTGPCIHLNGHFDVVPAGDDWTVDPFGGLIRDGRLYGRGSADMKAGLAAAIYAATAVRRVGISAGTLETSATVDEESGGFAGVAYLAEIGRIHRNRTDYVIIPEPFGIDGISLGHRGVYWFKITARGRMGHGSMPFLGRNAIQDLNVILQKVNEELQPSLATRTTSMPVVPKQARSGSINVNSIRGGQADAGGDEISPAQTPCVPDSAEAVFDRRFILEEQFEDVRAEVESLLEDATRENQEREYELTDILTVHPTLTSADSPLVGALERAIRQVVDQPARLVASPGTYDQKHIARIAGVQHCVAYGPGTLEQAHQPDESCSVHDIVTSAKVMAVAAANLLVPS